MSKFVHLHVHTEQSALDGLGSASEFAQRASELGHEAIAFTDHGTVRGLYEARKACAFHGLKLIPGCEFYVADDAGQRGLTKDEKAQIASQYSSKSEQGKAVKEAERLRRDRYHITAWALNNTGLNNLIALSNWAWLNGFYYKPRIDFAVLAEHAEGLAVSSGCCGSGVLARPLIGGKYESAQSRARFLRDTFGDRFYVEIMPHVPEGGEGSHPQLIRLADQVGARVIATQDAHYPREQDAIAQEALLCIQTRDRLDNPDRFSLGPQSYWLRSREEMLAAFARNVPELPPSVIDEALDETHRLARRCYVTWPEVEQGKYLVAPELPSEFSSYDTWLSELCADRWFERFPAPEPLPRYVERWHHELRVIKRLGFAPYFVMVWDVREWARKQGIRCGPGRGSAAGSLVSYLLGITDIDPLKYDLSFERFLAPGRTDLPDIDLDFQSDRRDEVFEYLRKRYGADRVAQISTYTRLKGKATLRDLARVYGLGDHEINPVLAAIRNVDPDEEVGEIQRAIDTTPAGREFSAAHPAVAEVAKRIEGTIKSVGQHPAGVVVSSVPLSEIVPIETRARGNKRVPVTGYDMRGVEASGLVKLDVLGLGHLTIIDIALRLCDTSSSDIDVEDKRVLDAFTRGDWGGIFQFDSPAARKLCRGVPFEQFADVAVMTALNRPGPMQSGLAAEYAARKAGQQKVTPVHAIYDEVMEQTYGVPIFQEQVVELVKRLCGYSPEEADKFRKAVAKKTGLAGYEDSFIAGAVRSGMSRADASALFERLVGFARYAFNRSHACAYATIACWCGWLREYFPGEFYAGVLTVFGDAQNRIRIAGDARRRGVNVCPPDVNDSSETYTIRNTGDGIEILGTLGDIDGIGPKADEALRSLAPFKDPVDFADRTRGNRAVTVKTFEALAKANALRSILPIQQRFLVANARTIWARIRDGDHVETAWQLPDYTDEERAQVIGSVWPPYVDAGAAAKLEQDESAFLQRCKREACTVGDLLSAPKPFAIAIGRVRSLRVYDEDGAKSGQVSLVGSDGAEAVMRADPDVLKASKGALDEDSNVVVAASATAKGNLRIEGAWQLGNGWSEADGLLGTILDPAKTRPRDIGAVIARAKQDRRFDLVGHVLRLRRHSDKYGRPMATLGLLGAKGYGRILVFSSRYAWPDTERLKIGAPVRIRVRKLSGDAVCLTDKEIEAWT